MEDVNKFGGPPKISRNATLQRAIFYELSKSLNPNKKAVCTAVPKENTALPLTW